jgi:hypothetical protein
MEIGQRGFKDLGLGATENVSLGLGFWNFLMRDSHALAAFEMNL